MTFNNAGLDGFQIGEPLTGEAQRNFEFVLRHYSVEVCERDGRLFIPQKWYADEESLELVWNYTNKSQDPRWMRQSRGF